MFLFSKLAFNSDDILMSRTLPGDDLLVKFINVGLFVVDVVIGLVLFTLTSVIPVSYPVKVV